MNKIEKIPKKDEISYKDDKLEYFINKNSTTNLVSYDNIITKIGNAKSLVLIASTSNVEHKIIDTLVQNNDINIYLILKSFNKSKDTLERFNKRRPAIIRQVEELENNFIIVDNISFLFINSLCEKENINIALCEDKTKDLKYLFHHYFWDCASHEKLLEEDILHESPYPPIGKRELDYINIFQDNISFDNIYIPRKKEYLTSLDKNFKHRYFCEDLKIQVYKKNKLLKIGSFVFEGDDFNLNNIWSLEEDRLEKIDSNIEIIPKDEIQNKPIKLQNKKEKNIGQIESNTIEEMESTKPKNFPKEKYIKNIIFKWEVLPPTKPKDSIKANLYMEYEQLNSEYLNQLKIIEQKLNSMNRDKNFMNYNIGVKEIFEELNKYKSISLEKLTFDELDNHLNTFESLKSKMETFSKEFESYKRKEKKVKNFSKNKNMKKLIRPKYKVPEVGELFETKDTYYLEIENYEELEIANSLKEQYIEKNFKIVAKTSE